MATAEKPAAAVAKKRPGPAKKTIASSIGKTQTMQVRLGQDGSVPKIIVLGRGQLAGRKLYATRLPESTIDRLRSLVSAPDYLALQIAVERFCDSLEAREGTEMIRADTLG
jgi:hypothetical protein